MTQLSGLKFVSDEELENPIERQKRALARFARKAVNKLRYIRRYQRVKNDVL